LRHNNSSGGITSRSASGICAFAWAEGPDGACWRRAQRIWCGRGGGESMLASILGGAGFALVGTRSVGAGGVGAVGGQTFLGNRLFGGRAHRCGPRLRLWPTAPCSASSSPPITGLLTPRSPAAFQRIAEPRCSSRSGRHAGDGARIFVSSQGYTDSRYNVAGIRFPSWVFSSLRRRDVHSQRSIVGGEWS